MTTVKTPALRPELLASFAVILVFSTLSAIQYPWSAGYDALGHMEHVWYMAEHWKLAPKEIYSSANPPLYYALMAVFWNLFHSEKLIQLFSLPLYWAECAMLAHLLLRRKVKQGQIAILVLSFALLPLTLNFAWMVFNYSLANFLIIATFYLILLWSEAELKVHHAICLAIVSGLAVLTSLTGMAAWIAGAIFVCRKKQKTLLAYYGLLTFVVLIPYFILKARTYGCVFCAPQRGTPGRLWWVPFPVEQYFSWDSSLLRDPVYHAKRELSGILSYLHATLFGDYWNYLIRPEDQAGTLLTEGKTLVGPHWIRPLRVTQLQILNILGIPITILGAGGIYLVLDPVLQKGRAALQSHRFLVFAVLCASLIELQFFFYNDLYRVMVNLHSGYLFAGVFCLYALTGEFSKNARRGWIRVFNAALLSLAAVSLWTFMPHFG